MTDRDGSTEREVMAPFDAAPELFPAGDAGD
jgi:hypothetical protein